MMTQLKLRETRLRNAYMKGMDMRRCETRERAEVRGKNECRK